MKAKKKISKISGATNNGKTAPGKPAAATKTTVKYTIEHSKEDVKILEKVTKILNDGKYYDLYKTKAKVLRDLPQLYLDAVKRVHDQDLEIERLTALLADYQCVKSNLKEVFELVTEKDKKKYDSLSRPSRG